MEGIAGVARPASDRAPRSSDDAGGNAVAAVAASDLRRHRWGWLAVGLAVAIAATVILAAAAGARRTITADERARLDTRAATTAVGVPKGLDEIDIDRIGSLPGVVGAARTRKYVGAIQGWERLRVHDRCRRRVLPA